MTMARKQLKLISMTAVAASTAALLNPMNAGAGAGVGYRPPTAKVNPLGNAVTSPYSSCKNVLIVSKDAYDSNGNYKNVKLPGGCDQVQSMPETGMFSHLSEAAQVLDFSKEVASKYLDNLNAKQKAIESLMNCFPAGKACDAQSREAYLESINQGASAIRAEMALAPSPAELMNRTGYTSSKASDHINTSAQAVLDYPSPLSGQPLSAAEVAKAQSTLAAEAAQVAAASSSKTVLLRTQAWQAIQDKHRAEYQKLIYGEYPIFATISPPAWKDGQPSWSDGQIHDALAKILHNVQEEQKLTNRAIDKGQVEFSNSQQIERSLIGGKRDLMSYMAFAPVVDQVLKEHPDMCGLATGINKYISAEQTRDEVGTVVGLGVAGVATGGAIGVLGVLGLGADGVIGAAVSAYATLGTGLGSTAYFIGTSANSYNAAKQQVLTRAAKNESQDVDYQQIESTKHALELNAAMALAMPEVGGLGLKAARAVLAKVAVRGATSETKADLVRTLASVDPEKLIAATDKALPAAQAATLKTEVETTAKEMKEVQGQVTKVALKRDPAELKELSSDPEITALLVSAEHPAPCVAGAVCKAAISKAEAEEKLDQAMLSCAAPGKAPL